MRGVAAASSGGWAPNGLATQPAAAAAATAGAQAAPRVGAAEGAPAGAWLVPSEEELWGRASKLGRLLDVFHPKAVVPLAGSLLSATDEAAGQLGEVAVPGFALSAHGLELKLLCASAAERDAWLGALRTAQAPSPPPQP